MKKLILISVTLILLVGALVAGRAFLGPDQSEAVPASTPESTQNLRSLTLKIDGMWCSSCAVGAEYALKEKQGIIGAKVDFKTAIGEVIYDPKIITPEEIISTVSPYEASIIQD